MVAVWHLEEGWLEVWGCALLPFGQGSVVVTFNRFPTLITAVFRGALGILCAAYFDENFLVEFEHRPTDQKWRMCFLLRSEHAVAQAIFR